MVFIEEGNNHEKSGIIKNFKNSWLYDFQFNGHKTDYKNFMDFNERIAKAYIHSEERIFEYMLCLEEIYNNCIQEAHPKALGRGTAKYKIHKEFMITKVKSYGYTQDKNRKSLSKGKSNHLDLPLVNRLCSKIFIQTKNNRIVEVTIYFPRFGHRKFE